MSKIACLDTPSGISGDMFLGCLLDAGWSLDSLISSIKQLPIPSNQWHLESSMVNKGSIRATQVTVHATESTVHRNIHDIRSLITASTLSQLVKHDVLAVFHRLAEAEAKVHNTSIEQVHFHEVGALDAIIDIVGTVAGIHALEIKSMYSTGIPLGRGWTRAMHGLIPIPAPATLEMLTKANALTRPTLGLGELTTPTGAALLTEFASFKEIPMIVERVGTGAGHKSFDWPNVARIWLGKSISPCSELLEIKTNIDDMRPELYEPVAQSLFKAGALDVWFAPIQMKKNRPSIMLSCLVPRHLEQVMTMILLEQTTSLGVRIYALRRHVVERKMREVETTFGKVSVKLKVLDGRVMGAKPEYDACKVLAEESNVTVFRVYAAANAAAHRAYVEVDGEE